MQNEHIMKKRIVILIYLVIALNISSKSIAQTSATITSSAACAALVVPMTITQDTPLHFGTFSLTNASGGTIVLSSNSINREFTGGVSSSPIAPIPQNASYHVTGSMNETYALTLPSVVTVTELTGSKGKATMTISLLKARFKNASSDGITSQLSANGTDSFTLGGTLNVGNGENVQTEGIYTGTFEVTVDYN